MKHQKLLKAASIDHHEQILEALEYGAEINTVDQGSNTSLHLKEKIEEPSYLILSVRSPMKTPLHKILSEVPPDRLLLIAGEKFFSEKEQEELAPFFNIIVRIKNYRDSGNLEVEVYKIYHKKPFQKVIAYHEYDLLRAARIRDFFHLDGQNYQSALVFRNKILMKNLLVKAGIRVPLFTPINSPLDILNFVKTYGFPAVIKPIFGTGTDGVYILNSLEEAEDFVSNYKGFNDYHLTDLEVESFIKGTTYHVDGLIQAGKIIMSWPSVCINHCVDLKTGSYVAHHHLSPENPMVKRLHYYAEQVLRVMPTPKNTAFLLEIFHEETTDEIIFCEIATRVGGGVKEMWPEAFGIDLENEFIRIQAGLKPSIKLTTFLDTSSMITTTLNAISGWIIFPKKLGVLITIPEVTPFPWVKEYIVRVRPGILIFPSKNISDSLASAFIVSDSENQFKERVELLNSWLQSECQWEKVFISPDIVKCIEDCEESIKQTEKINCEQVKKFIKLQEEYIEKIKKSRYNSPVEVINESSQSNLVLPLWQASQSHSKQHFICQKDNSPAVSKDLASNNDSKVDWNRTLIKYGIAATAASGLVFMGFKLLTKVDPYESTRNLLTRLHL